jgi:hypothetical protein
VGIPDGIQLKPGKLTSDEFEVMKSHAALGAQIIATAAQLLDAPSSSYTLPGKLPITIMRTGMALGIQMVWLVRRFPWPPV